MIRVDENYFNSPLSRFKIDKFHFIISPLLQFQVLFVYIYHEGAYSLTFKNKFTWFLCSFTRDFLSKMKVANTKVFTLIHSLIVLYTYVKSRWLMLELFKEFILLSLVVLESLDGFCNDNFHYFSYFSLKYVWLWLKNCFSYFQSQLFHLLQSCIVTLEAFL